MLDENDHHANSCDQSGHVLPTILPCEYPILSNGSEGGGFDDGCDRDNGVNFFGIHNDKAGSIQIGYTRNNLLLALCRGSGQPVGGVSLK